MRTVTLIPQQRLAAYLDVFTRRFLCGGCPRSADLEVFALELGDQFIVQGARLLGVTYDPDLRDLEIAFDCGDHRVIAPREVWSTQDEDGFVSLLAVLRDDGCRELLTVKKVGIIPL